MVSIKAQKDLTVDTLVCIEHWGQFRVSLNRQLSKRIADLYSEAFIGGEIYRRIEKGRKIRSFLFLKTATNIVPNLPEKSLLDICLSIEMCHAASILVDDILDGDDVRHGYQSSQANLGTPASALQAHFLCAEAINLVLDQPGILKLLLNTYRKLTIGEMYDVLMVEPINEWICKGYNEQIYQKTSAMFEYSFASAAVIANRNDLSDSFQKLGHAMGKLYQLSNDYHDLQPDNLRKRHAAGDSWRITFSFPLAIYLRLHGTSDISTELDQRMLTCDQWLKLLDKIWTKDVREFALNTLTQAEATVEECIALLPLPADVKMQFSCLVHLIVQEDFWYHPYDAQ
jgi:geranylgeranyl pyrophosphate synthase